MLDALAQQARKLPRAPRLCSGSKVITCRVANSRNNSAACRFGVSGKKKTPQPWSRAERQAAAFEPLSQNSR